MACVFWRCSRCPAKIQNMSGDLPPDMPETWVSLCNLMLKLCGISRIPAILGSDSPRVTIGRVTPFIPRERPNVINTLLLFFKATTAYTSAGTDASAALAPLFSGGTRARHWQSARRLWPDTRRLQLPVDDCCRLVLPYHAKQHATDGTDP